MLKPNKDKDKPMKPKPAPRRRSAASTWTLGSSTATSRRNWSSSMAELGTKARKGLQKRLKGEDLAILKEFLDAVVELHGYDI